MNANTMSGTVLKIPVGWNYICDMIKHYFEILGVSEVVTDAWHKVPIEPKDRCDCKA
jgi:hypothetical protein